MFWERGGTRRYRYHSRRIGSKLHRGYHGTGKQAELLYEAFSLQQAATREQHEKVQRILDAAQPTHNTLAEFTKWSDLLVKATLINAGYHLHQRIEWRQRIKLANSGDPTQLRQTLDDNPKIWQKTGDLGLAAEYALIELISDRNQLVRESVIRKIQELKKDLVPVNPTAFENHNH